MATEKNKAVANLEARIKDGEARLLGGMQALEKEYKLRRDYRVGPTKVDIQMVEIGGGKFEIRPEIQTKEGSLLQLRPTDHARVQMLERAKIPTRFADELLDLGLPDLLRANLLDLIPVTQPKGMLLREVEGSLKGWLSSAYQTLDASPIFESYVKASLAQGYVPSDGLVSDTRAFASFLKPELYEVAPGEYVIRGHELRTSDYGRGRLELNMALWRALCDNGAIGMDVFSRVHLGRRFDAGADGEAVEVSLRTARLDEATVRSMVNDAVTSMPEQTKRLDALLKEKVSARADIPKLLDGLRKRGMSKALAEQVRTLYEAPLGVEQLPTSEGAWRFSNVLGLLANKAQGDAQRDLQDEAFRVLMAA